MLKLINVSAIIILGLIFPTMILETSPHKVGILAASISEMLSAYIILDKRLWRRYQ